jgi:hypothetical protein
MRARTLLLCLLVAANAPLLARTPAARVLDQAVNTLVVKGSIEIDADGKVQRYTLEHPEAYSESVRGMLARIVPEWTFRPVLVDGAPVAARSAMYLRLQAEPIGDGQFRVVVAGATFGNDGNAEPGTQVAVDVRSMPRPIYPKDEIKAQIGAQVLVVVRVGRDGRVEDAIAEQTNLAQLGTSRAMARWRRDFEEAAVATLKRWKFTTPTRGPDAAAPYWSVRIPIAYTAGNVPANTPGKWNSYVPGPRRVIPWATDEEQALADTGLDALPGSGIFPLKPALQLLTPLNAG